ncbi:hypothetical protein C8R43DRAFT_1129391 [Mycena crocata]|nr:hypothetical protein C8R43DRAFT_1129391 [Mycena crocata]
MPLATEHAPFQGVNHHKTLAYRGLAGSRSRGWTPVKTLISCNEGVIARTHSSYRLRKTHIRDLCLLATCVDPKAHAGRAARERLVGFCLPPVDIWSGLSLLSQLTHLQVSFDANGFIRISLPLLRTCKSLTVLICLNTFHGYQGADKLIQAEGLQQEPQFVAMSFQYFCNDRQMGAHAGVDYWTRADDFIAKRRSGEIDPLQFRISEDASIMIV